MAIFEDMVENGMAVFMDDFLVFGDSFELYLKNLEWVLARCEEINLVLSCEKYHFLVQEGIVLGHKISKKGIEVDKEKKFNYREITTFRISESNQKLFGACRILQEFY